MDLTARSVYTDPDTLPFALHDLIKLPPPGRILLTSPEQYDIQYVINPHMKGNIGGVDQEKAQAQWNAIRRAYEALHLDVHVLPGVPGFLDMVFCANQTLPYITRQGERGVIASRMYAPQRRGEVPHFTSFFEEQGYTVRTLPASLERHFEGMGDALWHPGHALVWGGYGFRTDRGAYDFLAEWFGVPILPLHLHDPDFYHLDTCFALLDERSVLLYPDAFDSAGMGMIERLFERILVAPEEEARHLFACNAHCPDGRHVLIQEGCTNTCAQLREAGFVPVELDTSEYLKAGGSVFCMKLAYW